MSSTSLNFEWSSVIGVSTETSSKGEKITRKGGRFKEKRNGEKRREWESGKRKEKRRRRLEN